MILKGSKRSGGTALALHLLNEQDNEHIELHELRGFSADTLKGAFKEIEAISKGTRCRQYLFSLSLSPPETECVPVEQFEKAIEKIEKKLGLADQPRAIVFHEKEGRRHAHCVWSRIDGETMKAIDMPYFKMKLREISKELYLEHGWKLPKGFLDKTMRDPENFSLAEYQQAKRLSEDPKALKAMFQECWAASDNKQSFMQALEDRGFYLAAGDQRGFVAVDVQGEVYSLSRWVGVRSKELQARLGDSTALPSVSATKADLASRMTKTLEAHQKTIRQQIQNEAAPLLKERLAMQQRHREERERMKQFHDKRHAQETRNRSERMSKGMKAVWHWITGKYQKMREENERQLQKSKERDSAEKRLMIDTQLKERRLLQTALLEIRQQHQENRTALREYVAYYMRLGREAQSRPKMEFQKAEGRTRSQSQDKGRGREMD